jgi:cephalosporin-C deacetylase-like acetyl esterase
MRERNVLVMPFLGEWEAAVEYAKMDASDEIGRIRLELCFTGS